MAPDRGKGVISTLLFLSSVPLFALSFFLTIFCYIFAIPILTDAGNIYWYFPGDPPYADLCLICGILAVAAFLAALYLFGVAGKYKGERTSGKVGYTPALVIAVVMLAPTLLSLSFIASRHTGGMRHLKSELNKYSRIIAADSSIDPSGRLKNGQWKELESRYLSAAPQIHLEGLEHPVRIRMMSSDPPYVGADFGQGRNAQFNLATMLCVYSD
ncbi:MAG: hypothetical protein OEV92_05675 [Nitrospinota bacterium]|nr:hypothetical protein [Nitrospinota bacterium]